MKEFTAWGASSSLLASLVVLGSVVLLTTGPEVPADDAMDFWEASARGLVSVTVEDRTYQRGESTVTLPVGIRVGNRADVPVVLSEEAVLMSPFFAQSPVPDPRSTTQDAVLTTGTVPAGGSLVYLYGEDVLRGYLPEPPWWCSEAFQFTHAGVSFSVGGETLPFVLRPMLANRHWEGPESNTQADLWWYLRSHPAVVVGKDPLWAQVEAEAPARAEVRVRGTNLAVYTFDDDRAADVNVTAGWLIDRVPPGWTVEAGSFSVEPNEVVTNEDGSTTLRWSVDLPAALDGDEEDPRLPTEYETVERSYAIVSPGLVAGTHDLGRAASDMDGDGTIDAHSAPARLEAVAAEVPLVAHAGGPYEASEGTTVRLDATRSTGPEDASLRYRWDFTDDGAFDTDWSGQATADARYVDDFHGFARVELTDGTDTASATAPVSILNLAPEVLALAAFAEASFRLEAAGERWHDVDLTIRAGNEVLAGVVVTREPGSPSSQAATTEPVEVPMDGRLQATIVYTPSDDRPNGMPAGDNPAWLVVVLADRTEVRYGHNFNTQRPSTWTWTLRDLGLTLASHGVVLHARLRDAGADDLRVVWDFGDGTTLASTFPSGGAAPFEVTATAVHVFDAPRTYRVTVRVTDDDGGSADASLSLQFG
ncbi:MAG: PKD domain-containing protein [Methanobacteriota archaeon]